MIYLNLAEANQKTGNMKRHIFMFMINTGNNVM